MRASEVRQRYFDFFEKRGHKRISPSPIIPENDPTTLFTSSGMQQLVPYLMGEQHALGKRLVDSQPLLRAHGIHSDDTEEVGNNRHLTFFEMLGNWSLGDYFKIEQQNWIFEFLTSKEVGLGLDPQRIYVSVFEGNKLIEKDEESISIWKEIYSKYEIDAKEGERIFPYSDNKNWWSRSGTPEQMPVGEIGGPSSELFYDFGRELKLHENSTWKNEECHPNCDCGRFVEIGNCVFMQYKKVEGGKLEPLPQKNVDFGGGFERLVAASIDNNDVFKTDLFFPMIQKIESISDKKYGDVEKTDRIMRIIADHMRSAVMLIASDVFPSNKMQGYVLRKFIRRICLKLRNLTGDFVTADFVGLINDVVDQFEGIYIETGKRENIIKVFTEEVDKFRKTLDKGLKELEKLNSVNATQAFDLYQTYGFPLELTVELLQEKGQTVDKDEYQKEFDQHREKSRSAAAGMFKGGLADHSIETTKLHTVTHLTHAALRKVLGEHVQQKGSNITAERMRFDFVHPEKLTDEQIKEIEEMINAEIEKKLPVSFEIKTLDEALAEGALAFFGEKYAEKVKVYTVGDPNEYYFSKEVCGGPHVSNLAEIGGRVNVYKQEAVGSGVRRIYARILLDTNN